MTKIDSIVFVIEDDPSIREAITSLIRSVGMSVDAFASAKEFMTSNLGAREMYDLTTGGIGFAARKSPGYQGCLG